MFIFVYRNSLVISLSKLIQHLNIHKRNKFSPSGLAEKCMDSMPLAKDFLICLIELQIVSANTGVCTGHLI
jgi:hypothetical protein